MKNIQIIVAIISLGIYGKANSQENPEIKSIRVSELSFQTGLSGTLSISESFNTLRPLAPNSSILASLPGGDADFKSFGFNSNVFTSILMGLSFRNKQKTEYKTRPTLRLGISYLANNGVSGSTYRENRSPFDTLISSQGQPSILVDSVISNNYYIRYTSDQIRLDASLVFRSNPKHRLTAMAGVGVSAGVSINSNTIVTHNKYENTELNQPGGEKIYNFNGSRSEISEQTPNSTSTGYALFIPMGLDFQLGKTHTFWKNAHLFYEYRPGINFISIPELKTYSNVSMQHGIGVRVSI